MHLSEVFMVYIFIIILSNRLEDGSASYEKSSAGLTSCRDVSSHCAAGKTVEIFASTPFIRAFFS